MQANRVVKRVNSFEMIRPFITSKSKVRTISKIKRPRSFNVRSREISHDQSSDLFEYTIIYCKCGLIIPITNTYVCISNKCKYIVSDAYAVCLNNMISRTLPKISTIWTHYKSSSANFATIYDIVAVLLRRERWRNYIYSVGIRIIFRSVLVRHANGNMSNTLDVNELAAYYSSINAGRVTCDRKEFSRIQKKIDEFWLRERSSFFDLANSETPKQIWKLSGQQFPDIDGWSRDCIKVFLTALKFPFEQWFCIILRSGEIPDIYDTD